MGGRDEGVRREGGRKCEECEESEGVTNKNFVQQFVDQYKVESNRLLIQNTTVVLT